MHQIKNLVILLSINGIMLKKSFFTHADLASGGLLEIKMTNKL